MRPLFEKQGLHYLLLALLLTLVVLAGSAGGLLTGRFLGLSTSVWFYITIAIPILHQVYVWFVWRTQLHFSLITRWLGTGAFKYHAIIFSLFLVSRLASITVLAISSKHTLHFSQPVLTGLAISMLIPIAYLLYSIFKFFGVKRAMGMDHFDPSYQHMPLVKEGIFKITSNAMYTFGFLGMWIPGLLYASGAALLVALFSHMYIWVHYYCTEKPDMLRIYGKP